MDSATTEEIKRTRLMDKESAYTEFLLEIEAKVLECQSRLDHAVIN